MWCRSAYWPLHSDNDHYARLYARMEGFPQASAHPSGPVVGLHPRSADSLFCHRTARVGAYRNSTRLLLLSVCRFVDGGVYHCRLASSGVPMPTLREMVLRQVVVPQSIRQKMRSLRPSKRCEGVSHRPSKLVVPLQLNASRMRRMFTYQPFDSQIDACGDLSSTLPLSV